MTYNRNHAACTVIDHGLRMGITYSPEIMALYQMCVRGASSKEVLAAVAA